METYIIYFEDNTYFTFDLEKHEFEAIKVATISQKPFVAFRQTVIGLKNVRYITKQEIPQDLDTAVPEHLDQETFEYLKKMQRGEI